MRKLLAEIALKIYILLSEGELEMMAMLFAQRVILGKCEFEQVPEEAPEAGSGNPDRRMRYARAGTG